MTNLVLVVLCFFLGVGARRVKSLPADGHKVLNAWVVYVALPAVVLRSVHAISLEPSFALAAFGIWLVFFVAAGAVLLAVRKHRSRAPVLGALALCAALPNTSFVGLPLLEALGGPDVLGPAVIVDQLGAFTALFLFAVPLAMYLGGEQPTLPAMLWRMVTFPPFIALVLAIALKPVAFPTPVETVLSRLADMMSPLALAAVGWQLDVSALKGHGRNIALGLAYKLAFAPALVLGLLWLASPHFGLVERVAVAQAAMAPMVTAGVVASDNDLDGRLASGLIAVGVPLSLVTVPAWWWLLGRLGGS